MCESFTFCDVKLVSKRGHEVVTISHRRASYSAQDGDVLTSLMTQLQTDPDAYWKERFLAELLFLMFMPGGYWLANLIERLQDLTYIYIYKNMNKCKLYIYTVILYLYLLFMLCVFDDDDDGGGDDDGDDDDDDDDDDGDDDDDDDDDDGGGDDDNM